MLLDVLELFSNQTLAHDAGSLERLERLQGKAMVLTVKPIDLSLAVTPYREGLEFSQQIPAHTDVTLRATVGALLKISRDGFDGAELEPGELEIEGDPIVGQRFAMILAELDIDWDSLLREQFGDGPAQVIQFAVAQAKDFTTTTRDHLKVIAKRILNDDLALLADKQEVEQVLDDIDDLRADSDRLMARVQRVQRRLDSEPVR